MAVKVPGTSENRMGEKNQKWIKIIAFTASPLSKGHNRESWCSKWVCHCLPHNWILPSWYTTVTVGRVAFAILILCFLQLILALSCSCRIELRTQFPLSGQTIIILIDHKPFVNLWKCYQFYATRFVFNPSLEPVSDGHHGSYQWSNVSILNDKF